MRGLDFVAYGRFSVGGARLSRGVRDQWVASQARRVEKAVRCFDVSPLFRIRLSRAGFILAACILALSPLLTVTRSSRATFSMRRPSGQVRSFHMRFVSQSFWHYPISLDAVCRSRSICTKAGPLRRRLKVLLRLTRLAAGFACLAAAWITGEQAWSEYLVGVWTNTYMPIPKWWLFVFIPYGLLSAGIYFLRQACGEAPHSSEEAVQ